MADPQATAGPPDREALRNVAAVIAGAMHEWVEITQTDIGYEITNVDGNAKAMEVFAALTVDGVWQTIAALLRADPQATKGGTPDDAEAEAVRKRDRLLYLDQQFEDGALALNQRERD